MPQYIEVPPQRLPAEVLQALLEEYASRDGTDYGEREVSLEDKVTSLRSRVVNRDLRIVFETESEQWDIVPAEDANDLLQE